MKARTGLLACLIVVLGGYVAMARNTTEPPKSSEFTIILPSPDLSPELAAFSGIWVSNSGGVLPSRLIVEEIHPNWASVVYTWGDHPTEGLTAGWARARARVLPDGKLRWGFPGKFTVEISSDRMSIHGKKEQAGSTATFAMRKAGSFAAQ